MRALSLAACLLASAPAASAAVGSAGDGMAEQGSGARVDLARSHFQRGVSLYRSGAFDAALAEFTRAYEAVPSYRILYNLARIQAERHDYVASVDLFARYLADGGSELIPQRVLDVRREMDELERRISRLHVDANVDDGQLFINDSPAANYDEPLRLNAGIYRLRLQKPGYVAAARTVTLTGGDDTTVSLELSAELDMDDSPAPAPPPAPAAPAAPVDRTAFWTSLVATGVLTSATVSFGLLTRRANTTLDRQLAEFPAPRGEIEQSRGRVRTYAFLTDAFGVAAATALGLTTYFYLSDQAEAEVPPPASQLGAQLRSDGAALTWAGTF